MPGAHRNQPARRTTEQPLDSPRPKPRATGRSRPPLVPGTKREKDWGDERFDNLDDTDSGDAWKFHFDEAKAR